MVMRKKVHKANTQQGRVSFLLLMYSIRIYIQNTAFQVVKELEVWCQFKILNIASLIIDVVICPH